MTTGLVPFRPLGQTQKPSRDSRVQGGHSFLRGLLGYWLFNEYGGTRTRNLYGPSGDLVYSSTPEWTRGGGAVSGGTYLEAVTPTAVGPLSLMMGVILRSSGFTRYAQWDSIGPILFNYSGSVAIVFQNTIDYYPGTVPVATGIPAIIGLAVDGSTARVFSYQSGVFSYAETGAFGRSYAGFTKALRVGTGALAGGGASDASDAVFLWTAIHNRALGIPELRALCARPYAPVTPPGPAPGQWYVSISATLQYAYPASDVSAGGWTTELGSSSNLYTSIDETVADDADYIQSGLGTSNFGSYRSRLASFSVPADTTNWAILLRSDQSPYVGAQPVTLRIRLYLSDGTTLVHDETITLTGTVAAFSLALTGVEAALVTQVEASAGLVIDVLPVAV